jgi:hypothetical protein
MNNKDEFFIVKDSLLVLHSRTIDIIEITKKEKSNCIIEFKFKNEIFQHVFVNHKRVIKKSCVCSTNMLIERITTNKTINFQTINLN